MSDGVISRKHSVLCLIDVQERLFPHIANKEGVEKNIAALLEGAGLLEMPVLWNEQYPQGLGHTIPSLAAKLEGKKAMEKTSFSCFGNPDFLEAFRTCLADTLTDQLKAACESAMPLTRRTSLILCGIESHICVLQTALDALEGGFRPVVVTDAIGSRDPQNHKAALDRLCRSGVTLASTEMLLMEWLRDAKHPQFKAIQKLIK